MMKVLRAIGAAVVAALRSIGNVMTAPLRWLGGGAGGSPWGLPETPEIDAEPPYDPVAAQEKRMAEGIIMANALMGYAIDSLVSAGPAPLPDRLTPELKSWARGLSVDECIALVNANERSISAHIKGLFLLPGVREVQPLPPATWPPEPSVEIDDGFDISAPACAAGP